MLPGPPGLTEKLQDWKEKFQVGGDIEQHIIIDADHWPSFGSRGIYFPTQITHITVMFFDVDGSFRFATPREHLQAMGFNVDMGSGTKKHAAQTIAEGQNLSGEQVKLLAGNGMHLHIFGAWMSYVLSMVQPNSDFP